MTAYVTATFSPLVGRTQVAARLPVPDAVVSVSRVVGTVRPRVAGTPEVRCAVQAVIGRTRIKGYANADAWTTAGYPVPNLEGYTFSRNSGVQRTTMRSGVTRQRRRWQNGRGAAEIVVDLPLALLNKFEADVDAYGYDWFTMPLVTGANAGPAAESHTVRIVGDMRLGSVYGSTIRVNLPIEYVLQGRTGLSTTTLGTDAAAKTAAAVFSGGSYAQTVFPLSIKAVASYPGSAIVNEYYMEIASGKSLAGALTSGGYSQTTSENSKTLAGLLASGGTLVQGTYRNIENGTGAYHLDPLEAAAATGAAVFAGGTLLNYVNVDNIIVSVPDGRNYIGTSDTQTAAAVFSGGSYIQDPVTGSLVINIEDEGAGTYYAGPSETKTWAGNFNGGSYIQDPIPGALVINIEDEGAGTYYAGPADTRTWSGVFNGGAIANTDNTINATDDGGSYAGTADTKTWAGNFNGGTLVNTDNTIASGDDGGSYMEPDAAKSWAGNFNGGALTN